MPLFAAVKEALKGNKTKDDLSPDASDLHSAQIARSQSNKLDDRKFDAPPAYDQIERPMGSTEVGQPIKAQHSSSSSASSITSVSSAEFSKQNPSLTRFELKALKRQHKDTRRLARREGIATRRANKSQSKADRKALKAQQDAEIAQLASAARIKGERRSVDPGYMAKEFGDRGLALAGRDFFPTFGGRMK